MWQSAIVNDEKVTREVEKRMNGRRDSVYVDGAPLVRRRRGDRRKFM